MPLGKDLLGLKGPQVSIGGQQQHAAVLRLDNSFTGKMRGFSLLFAIDIIDGLGRCAMNSRQRNHERQQPVGYG